MTQLADVEREARPIARDDVRAFLRSALDAPRVGPLAVSMPSPTGRPRALLERTRRGHAFHLHDERRVLTTLGATRLHRATGSERFENAALAFDAARSALRSRSHERAPNADAVWTFGFAFAPGRARDSWAPLGDGLLTLPRWAHRVESGRATLTLVVDRDEPSGSALPLAELDAIWDALESNALPTPSASDVRVRHVALDRWSRSVGDVGARISAGQLRKVVVARRSAITSDRDLDPVRMLARLERPGAIRFCVRQGGAAFVGATPERLFRKRGRHVRTEALAGTASLELDPEGRRLLASAKDRHEHRLVVDGIAESLAGLHGEVSIGAMALRTIGSVAHLATPIEAHLGSSTSAFDLLAALHPTPAVGGVPRSVALDWIAEHEPDRGWYAGPIGWIDANGDADAVVALRSALVVGARAYAYAGAGIVEGSDPEAEYAETTLKLAPMLAAIGAA